MALANVALTDTFDYWRTVTNSLVVAINDKLVYCNTSNANTVSIPSFASRTSNLYVNIITSTSLNDTATGNVASAYTANTLQGLALVYTSSANSNAQFSVTAANNYASILAANNAAGANNWANTKLSNTSGMSFAGSLYVPGNLGIGNDSPSKKLHIYATGGVSETPQLVLEGGTNGYGTGVSFASRTSAGGTLVEMARVVADGDDSWNTTTSTQDARLTFWTTINGTAYERLRIAPSGFVGIGTTNPLASLEVAGSVSVAKANVLSQILTDGTTINWDTSLGQVATITLGGNRVMAAPTNLKVGTYILHVIQDGSGNRTVTWNSIFKWPAGVAPVLTTTGNRRDLFSFVCDGTNLYGSYLPDVR